MVANGLEPTYVHVPRYAAGSPESLEHLNNEGFVVIANALNAEQAESAIDLTWAFLEGLGTGIDRAHSATWGDDRWPVAVHGGIIPSQGVGHSEAQWFIRSVPAVKEAFAAVWNDEELLVSFDGMAIWRPPAVDTDWRTNRGGSWLHIDQHPIGRPGFHCVQGLVNLLPTSPATGGNVIIPGSHRRFETIPELYTDRLARIPEQVDHFRFPADDPQLSATPPVMPHMEPGDLLLWDSRTIHCSSPGLVESDATDLIRIASLVCMMPKAKSNERVIARRHRAIEERTSTTNWSDRFINADKFPEVLATERAFELPPVPVLDSTQAALVG